MGAVCWQSAAWYDQVAGCGGPKPNTMNAKKYQILNNLPCIFNVFIIMLRILYGSVCCIRSGRRINRLICRRHWQVSSPFIRLLFSTINKTSFHWSTKRGLNTNSHNFYCNIHSNIEQCKNHEMSDNLSSKLQSTERDHTLPHTRRTTSSIKRWNCWQYLTYFEPKQNFDEWRKLHYDKWCSKQDILHLISVYNIARISRSSLKKMKKNTITSH